MNRNFTLFIVNRALSGVVNGLYYAQSSWTMPVLILLCALTVYELTTNLNRNMEDMSMTKIWLSCIGIFSSIVCCIMLGVSFRDRDFYFSDIHLWTFLHQTAIAGTYFFSSKNPLKQIWWLVLAVTPSSFLQKFFINTLSGLDWDYVGTDDPTGHFWGMTVFGMKIMVPRLADMHIKLIIAIGCVALFFIIRWINRDKKT